MEEQILGVCVRVCVWGGYQDIGIGMSISHPNGEGG